MNKLILTILISILITSVILVTTYKSNKQNTITQTGEIIPLATGGYMATGESVKMWGTHSYQNEKESEPKSEVEE